MEAKQSDQQNDYGETKNSLDSNKFEPLKFIKSEFYRPESEKNQSYSLRIFIEKRRFKSAEICLKFYRNLRCTNVKTIKVLNVIITFMEISTQRQLLVMRWIILFSMECGKPKSNKAFDGHYFDASNMEWAMHKHTIVSLLCCEFKRTIECIIHSILDASKQRYRRCWTYSMLLFSVQINIISDYMLCINVNTDKNDIRGLNTKPPKIKFIDFPGRQKC